MRIELEGAKNIRDFSEYGFPGYIRSSHLHDITEKDAQMLAKNYHLKTVIDLRTNVEREENPDYAISGVNFLRMPLFDDAVLGISHESALDRFDAEALPDMVELYRMLVTDRRCIRQIKKVMDVILSPARDGAVLWHCTEGKDRCGLISALFLMIKGFDYDTVLQDYLKTNAVNVRKAEQYYAHILAEKKSEQLAAAVRNALLAKKEYFDAAYHGLQEISETYLPYCAGC